MTLNREQLQSGGHKVVVAVMEDSAVERKENFQGFILLTQQSLDLRVITISQSLGEVTIIDNDGTYMSLLLCAPTIINFLQWLILDFYRLCIL